MHSLYHSTFGETADGLQKPELVAPAIWVPAPVPLGTQEHKAAIALFGMLNATNEVYLNAWVANNLVHLRWESHWVEKNVGKSVKKP